MRLSFGGGLHTLSAGVAGYRHLGIRAVARSYPVADAPPPGLPAGLDRVVNRIRRLCGHEVQFEARTDSPFNDAEILLYIDGELVGTIEPWWDSRWPAEQVLTELTDKIEEDWAQELGGGLWGRGVQPGWDEEDPTG